MTAFRFIETEEIGLGDDPLIAGRRRHAAAHITP
jgi:hypothetical protein